MTPLALHTPAGEMFVVIAEHVAYVKKGELYWREGEKKHVTTVEVYMANGDVLPAQTTVAVLSATLLKGVSK